MDFVGPVHWQLSSIAPISVNLLKSSRVPRTSLADPTTIAAKALPPPVKSVRVRSERMTVPAEQIKSALHLKVVKLELKISTVPVPEFVMVSQGVVDEESPVGVGILQPETVFAPVKLFPIALLKQFVPEFSLISKLSPRRNQSIEVESEKHNLGNDTLNLSHNRLCFETVLRNDLSLDTKTGRDYRNGKKAKKVR
jgi:hypothetical protein